MICLDNIILLMLLPQWLSHSTAFFHGQDNLEVHMKRLDHLSSPCMWYFSHLITISVISWLTQRISYSIFYLFLAWIVIFKMGYIWSLHVLSSPFLNCICRRCLLKVFFADATHTSYRRCLSHFLIRENAYVHLKISTKKDYKKDNPILLKITTASNLVDMIMC